MFQNVDFCWNFVWVCTIYLFLCAYVNTVDLCLLLCLCDVDTSGYCILIFS